MKKEDTIRLFKEARDVELKNVEVCKEQEEKMTQESQKGAKLMLEIIRRDSDKHARIYEVLIELLEQEDADYLWESNMDKFVSDAIAKKSFDNHLKIENAMIAQVQNLLEQIDHPGLKMILKLVVDDEKMHHYLLNHIKDRLFQIKT